jgi:DNA-directed RNA polymerase omega subunit
MPVSRTAPDSQFAYVVVVARRARQLMIGGRPMVENPRSRKNTRVAEEELQRGFLEFQLPDDPEGAEEKEGKRRK